MKQIKSEYILSGLIIIMIIIKFFDIIFDPVKIFPGRTAAFPWSEILISLIFGILGLIFYKKIDLPDFNNKEIRKIKTISYSIGYGLLFSILLVIWDLNAKIGDLSVGWPLSIIFYIWGAISSEIIFRLFAISFIVWLFSNIIFKKKYNRQIFWIGSVILSLSAASIMLMAFSNPEISLKRPDNILFSLLGIIVLSSELAAYLLLKKYGFLSNLIFRLSFYLVWHILWPVIFY